MPESNSPATPDPASDAAELKRRMDETLESFARLQSNIPAMIQKVFEEQKSNPASTAEDRIAALERLLAEEQGKRVRTERENKIRSAIGTVPWCDPEDAVNELLAKSDERDGRLVVVGSKKFSDSGQEFPEVYSLDEAVKNLAARKPHWVKAEVKGGSGASGNSSSSAPVGSVDWDAIRYRDLRLNPVLMQRAIVEKGQAYVAALHDRWRAKQASKEGASI
jgi:hypothetical protein